jgi:hypothetical protein
MIPPPLSKASVGNVGHTRVGASAADAEVKSRVGEGDTGEDT